MAEFLRVQEHPHSQEDIIPLDATRLYLDELLQRDQRTSPDLVNPDGWELLASKYPESAHLVRGIAFSILTANNHRLHKPAQRMQMRKLFVPKGLYTQDLMTDLLAARVVGRRQRSVEQEAFALHGEVFAMVGPKVYTIPTVFKGIITERIGVPIPAA